MPNAAQVSYGYNSSGNLRVLGSGDFVERPLEDAQGRERETLRLRRGVKDLNALVQEVCEKEGLSQRELRSGSRVKKVSKASRAFCRLAVREMGYAGAESGACPWGNYLGCQPRLPPGTRTQESEINASPLRTYVTSTEVPG